MTRSRSKFVAASFLLGALLTGGVGGYLMGKAANSKTVLEPAVHSDTTFSNYSPMAQDLGRNLLLSSDQMATVDSIFMWRRERYNEILLPVRSALDSARDSARALIDQKLDSRQREAFIKLLNLSSPPADSNKADSKEQ